MMIAEFDSNAKMITDMNDKCKLDIALCCNMSFSPSQTYKGYFLYSPNERPRAVLPRDH